MLVIVGYSLSEEDALLRFLVRQFAEDLRDASGKYIFYIDYTKPETGPNGLYVGLGDNDMDPSAREGSMPTFEANYKRDGDAKCKVGGANS